MARSILFSLIALASLAATTSETLAQSCKAAPTSACVLAIADLEFARLSETLHFDHILSPYARALAVTGREADARKIQGMLTRDHSRDAVERLFDDALFLQGDEAGALSLAGVAPNSAAHVEYLAYISQAFRRQGNPERATETVNRAMTIAATLPQAARRSDALAGALLQEGRYEDALAHAPQDPAGLKRLSFDYAVLSARRASADTEEGTAALDARFDALDAEAQRYVGYAAVPVWLRLDDAERMTLYIDTVLDDRDRPFVNQSLVRIAGQIGRADLAERYAAQVDKAGDRARVLQDCADAAQQAGHEQTAQVCHDAARGTLLNALKDAGGHVFPEDDSALLFAAQSQAAAEQLAGNYVLADAFRAASVRKLSHGWYIDARVARAMILRDNPMAALQTVLALSAPSDRFEHLAQLALRLAYQGR